LGFKSGLTDLCTKDYGKMTKQTVQVEKFMLMVMFIKVTGKMIKLMDLVFTLMLMGPSIPGSG